MTPLRKKVLIAAGVVTVLLVLIFRTPVRIALHDRAYNGITPGMTEADVLARMGSPHRIETPPKINIVQGWDDQPTDVDEQRLGKQFWYTIETWYLPVSWTIAFDEDGRAVLKHRWD